MTTVLVSQKPGCGTNARQVLALRDAGHEVIVRSLLAEPWTRESLLAFFGAAPVASWFNPASPKVKSGAIDPGALGEAAALDLMLADPLLIRRPLVEAEGARCAGFDREPVLGLLRDAKARPGLQGCSRREPSESCKVP